MSRCQVCLGRFNCSRFCEVPLHEIEEEFEDIESKLKSARDVIKFYADSNTQGSGGCEINNIHCEKFGTIARKWLRDN